MYTSCAHALVSQLGISSESSLFAKVPIFTKG